MTAKFFIEISHESNPVTCARHVEVFLRSGSHFFTHAVWGCNDGEHKAWLIVDVESREDAWAILPPVFRSQAKIVQLNAFSMEDIENTLRQHQ